MQKRPRSREPYKKLLSIFEVQTLIQERAQSAIFTTNRKGERILEGWLKELRFNQAWQVAEEILGRRIEHQEFQDCWERTQRPGRKNAQPSEPPNTATFGGYRLKTRSALNRAQKQKPRPKRK
jgi:hypothetical protein